MKRRRSRVGEKHIDYIADAAELLLDAHVWLWWRAAHPRLGPTTRQAIRAAKGLRFSAASAWEIAIKAESGKLTLPPRANLPVALGQDGIVALPISVEHALAAARLPALHRDPFDRMLVAQAMAEDLVLVTADAALSRYGVRVLDAAT